ncbi:MAG: hypothetical protein JW779_01800 [Candidatus Thorarchaeota archaeon]|nr:hypothetical protein [Candidatus Thorarchaeota archaeon]
MDENSKNSRSCEDVLDDVTRGELLLDMRRVVRHPIHFVKITDPFITAHHPFCSHFDGHIVTIRGRKWCIGCTFNSISFFGTMLFLFAIWTFNPTLLNRFYLFWGGVGLSIVYFLVSSTGITENRKRAKILSKFLLGSGFASICWSILLIELVSFTLALKLLFILILYLGFITLLNIKRSLEIFRECRNCEYKMRWSKCPGFRDVACKLIDGGYIHAKN